MIFEVLKYPNDILTTPTRELTPEEITSSKIQGLIKDMADTVIDAGGLGLAAPQVGKSISLFVYVVEPALLHPPSDVAAVINPRYLYMKYPMHSKAEGCLSLPGQRFNVKNRFKRVKVEAFDHEGNPILLEPKSKRLSVVLQHEIDHLNGMTLVQRGKAICC